MVARHLAVGQAGENAAASFLISLGYSVVVRNFRCRQGEIDLIVEQKNTLVFVEVKTRAQSGKEHATQAVDYKKRVRLIRAASQYLSQNELWDRACRFDVIVVSPQNRRYECEHYINAFDAEVAAESDGFFSPF